MNTSMCRPINKKRGLTRPADIQVRKYIHAQIYEYTHHTQQISKAVVVNDSKAILNLASRRRAPARLRQTEPRKVLTVRGVPKGALRTHSAQQAPLWGTLITCVEYCLCVCQC